MTINNILNGYKVRQFEGDNGPVKNQFLIYTPDGAIIFQSYSTVIAIKKDGDIYLDRDSWDYSRTTGKYRNQFLNEDITATRRKIKNGDYILTDLN